MTLVQELNRTKNKVGLVSGSLKINEYDDAEQSITAAIDPKNWNIEINLRKGFEAVQTRRQRAYARVKKIKDGRRKILEDMLCHELAHWELPFNSGYGCPYDTYNHDLILEAVKEALPEDKQSHASYVANAFEDMLINPRCREFKGDFSGQVLFWDHQGIESKARGQKHYTPFYEAFVKLNMHLFGDKIDNSLLKKHYSNSKKVDEAVQAVIKELNLEENTQDSSTLFVKENWPRMASIFVEKLADLLEQTPTERLSGFLGSEGGKDSKKQKPGNGIEQKSGTRGGKEDIAFGRYSADKDLSPNIESYEQLDSLYRRLAKAIPVRVEAMTRKHSLAVAPLNFRAFDEEKDDIRKVKPTKLYFTENGLTFGYEREPITVTEKSKVQRRSFPDFKLLYIDDSGTMAEGINGSAGNQKFIPWGDNSKYHYLLLGKYGIEQFLQMQGVAQYINHGLGIFSTDTKYEESDYTNLSKLDRLALSPRFGGSTKIDTGKLINAMQGKGNFVLTISDGLVHNWDSEKDEFEKLARDNYFAHIQIGSENGFTQDLESMGFPVFYVSSGKELSGLMVDITTDTYKRFTQQ